MFNFKNKLTTKNKFNLYKTILYTKSMCFSNNNRNVNKKWIKSLNSTFYLKQFARMLIVNNIKDKLIIGIIAI